MGTAGVMLNDGRALVSVGLRRPALAADLRHIEICWHGPTKALLHGRIKIARRAGVVVSLTRRHF